MYAQLFSCKLVEYPLTRFTQFQFNARSRFRDHGSWSSWGAPTVLRETGYRLEFSSRIGSFTPGEDVRFLSRLFLLVIHALGRANCTPPQVEVLLLKQGLPDAAFVLPESLRSSVEPVLRNMSTLLLNVDLMVRHHFTFPNWTGTHEFPGRTLGRFLSYTSNLKHLRLNFKSDDCQNNEPFLEWLGKPAYAPGIQPSSYTVTPPIVLPYLKQLEFGSLNMQRPEILLSIVAKFAPTLENLSLWKICLLSALPLSAGQKPNYWKNFLTRLVNIPQLQLTYLKMGMLRQDGLEISFMTGEGENVEEVKFKEYSGREMSAFMDKLTEQISVPWPLLVSHDEGQSDEDEDMSDGSDDDNEENEESEDDEEEENADE